MPTDEISRVLSMLEGGLSNLKISPATDQSDDKEDQLNRFPTEIRLMIFKELLVFPGAVVRGGSKFGPVDEFKEDTKVPWQILLTCHKYYEEAMPILYGNNKFIFCTGEKGTPGMFWRFPIKPKFLALVKHLGIYLRADQPASEASRRVAHFIDAVNHRANKLVSLEILVSSDRFYDAACPWDIIFCHHPVAKALDRIVLSNKIPNLHIRLHNNAYFHPEFAQYLKAKFESFPPSKDRSLFLSRSCTCPESCIVVFQNVQLCRLCYWPTNGLLAKPAVLECTARGLESPMERMMNMQAELFDLGILPPEDEEDEDEDEVEVDETQIPWDDSYEEARLAFHSGVLLPGEVRRYRSPPQAPKTWAFRQTTIYEFFPLLGRWFYLPPNPVFPMPDRLLYHL